MRTGQILRRKCERVKLSDDNANWSSPSRATCELVKASGDNANWSSSPATMRTGQALRRQCELVKPSEDNANWSSPLATMRTGHALPLGKQYRYLSTQWPLHVSDQRPRAPNLLCCLNICTFEIKRFVHRSVFFKSV